MRNQKEKKLSLKRTTVRILTPNQLDAVVGGEGIIVIGGSTLSVDECPPR